MKNYFHEVYELAVRSARHRIMSHPALAALFAADAEPAFLEMFLVQFNSLGVGMTEPVEDSLRRAGQLCQDAGLPDVARALRGHARRKAGHRLLMIRDTYALVQHWNERRRPALDADRLLDRTPTPASAALGKLHAERSAGPTAFVALAIEYEIEMLLVRLGAMLLERAAAVLGASVRERLSFLREHITFVAEQARFDEHLLEQLLRKGDAFVEPLAAAGSAALDAYAAFLSDCVQLARPPRQGAQPQRELALL
jgi:hypothetical protein